MKTALCPVCEVPSPVDDAALAAKRGSCPRHGEFALTPARISDQTYALPATTEPRGTSSRILVGVNVFVALLAVRSLGRGPTPRTALFFGLLAGCLWLLWWTSLIRVSSGRLLARGQRTPLSHITRFDTENSPPLFDAVVAQDVRLRVVAWLRDGRRRVIAERLLPPQADLLRRQLEMRLR
jgi:hypothetical protein